jgi:alcohol dehydrogenase
MHFWQKTAWRIRWRKFIKKPVSMYIFGGAEPNPTDKNVAAGIECYREHGCNGIVSLGGGSSHDCAKGIGLVAANGGNIRDYEGVDKSSNDMIPLMAINTTAGTALKLPASVLLPIQSAR